MRRWISMGLVGLWLATSGCAYQQAMKKGDSLAASGDWDAAYQAYDEAVQIKPDSEDARIARQRAEDHAVEEALNLARKALEQGQYEEVISNLEKVTALDRDRPEVFDLRTEVQRRMADDYARLWDMGEHKHAYTIASRTKELFPEAEHLAEALPQLREHFLGESQVLLDEEKYAEALDAVGIILEYEPDRTADTAPMEQKIRGAWSKELVEEAKTYEQQRKMGAAALTYARAYELAGRRADLEQARSIARDLGEDATFTIDVRLSGEYKRVPEMKEQLTAALDKLPDAEVVNSRADLTARIQLGSRECTETDKVTAATKDFISGQIEVDNPEHGELTEQLATARENEAAAKASAEEMYPDVQAATADLEALDQQMTGVQKAHDQAKTQLDMADNQLESARKRKLELETELQQQQATGAASGMIETTTVRLDEAKKRIVEWEEQVATLQAAYDEAKADLDALQVERGPAAEALERLKSGYEALIKERNDNARLAGDLSQKLAGTSKTLMQDVEETFEYEIHDWVRKCLAPTTAQMDTTWRDVAPTKLEYTPVHVTKDRSHVGHVEAEVEEDPKEFPESDDELVAKGDAETRAAVVEWVGNLVGAFYSDQATEAKMALTTDPIDGATELVTLYLGAGNRLDEQTVETFEAHAEQHFGVEKLNLLKPGGTVADEKL